MTPEQRYTEILEIFKNGSLRYSTIATDPEPYSVSTELTKLFHNSRIEAFPELTQPICSKDLHNNWRIRKGMLKHYLEKEPYKLFGTIGWIRASPQTEPFLHGKDYREYKQKELFPAITDNQFIAKRGIVYMACRTVEDPDLVYIPLNELHFDITSTLGATLAELLIYHQKYNLQWEGNAVLALEDTSANRTDEGIITLLMYLNITDPGELTQYLENMELRGMDTEFSNIVKHKTKPLRIELTPSSFYYTETTAIRALTQLHRFIHIVRNSNAENVTQKLVILKAISKWIGDILKILKEIKKNITKIIATYYDGTNLALPRVMYAITICLEEHSRTLSRYIDNSIIYGGDLFPFGFILRGSGDIESYFGMFGDDCRNTFRAINDFLNNADVLTSVATRYQNAYDELLSEHMASTLDFIKYLNRVSLMDYSDKDNTIHNAFKEHLTPCIFTNGVDASTVKTIPIYVAEKDEISPKEIICGFHNSARRAPWIYFNNQVKDLENKIKNTAKEDFDIFVTAMSADDLHGATPTPKKNGETISIGVECCDFTKPNFSLHHSEPF